jgi:type IV pilus assembly protein PilW
MRRQKQTRGFTLLELLITAAISGFVITGISMAFISQAQQYQAHAGRRGTQSSARQGLHFIETQLRLAGFGVDPGMAISAFDSFDPAALAKGTDFPDGIAIHYRDPMFNRTVLKDGNVITIQAGGGFTETVYKGQAVLLMCPGARRYGYFVVNQTVLKDTFTLDIDPNPVLADSPVSGPGKHFRDNLSATPLAGCFSDGSLLSMVMINRYAFYVDSFDSDGRTNTPGETPYLMLHRGLDVTGDGRIDKQDAAPLSAGVEQLQIAYMTHAVRPEAEFFVLRTPQVLGVRGVVFPDAPHWGDEWRDAELADVALGIPPYVTDKRGWWKLMAYENAFRNKPYPGNIAQVRVSVVSRSTHTDPGRVGDEMNPANAASDTDPNTGVILWKQMENLGTSSTTSNKRFVPNKGGYLRSVLRISVAPKQLLNGAGQFMPTVTGGG